MEESREVWKSLSLTHVQYLEGKIFFASSLAFYKLCSLFQTISASILDRDDVLGLAQWVGLHDDILPNVLIIKILLRRLYSISFILNELWSPYNKQ